MIFFWKPGGFEKSQISSLKTVNPWVVVTSVEFSIFQTAQLVNLQKKWPCCNTTSRRHLRFPMGGSRTGPRSEGAEKIREKNPIKVIYMDHPGSSHRSSRRIMANSVMAYDLIDISILFA